MPHWRPLRDGGTLLYLPAFYAPAEADALFATLVNDLHWQQLTTNGYPLPRLNAWFADLGLAYHYSGIAHEGRGWPDDLDAVRLRVEAAAEARFNSLLLNRYRDGRDSIGFHSDAEPELGPNPVVATLSLGAERTLVLRHKRRRERLERALGHGSLLVLGGTTQHHWLHGIAKTEAAVGERVSLTYRWIVEP
jgi:alkylated DNA repair dioxygenase AlkB